MKKIISILVLGMFLLSTVLVSANGGHESGIEEGRKLVESSISCDKLNDDQLEEIGEYYMEQMHPGESHEAMHKMMGIEEGTEYHKDFHINIAKMMYCGESGGMNYGMMGGGMMMPMMMNMMGGNMMRGMSGNNMMSGNMMQGMMGNLGYQNSYWNFMNIFYVILLIGLVILVCLVIVKLSIGLKTKRR